MIQGCLNWNKAECLSIQDNNALEVIEDGLGWCNATMDAMAWESLTPLFVVKAVKNPYGGTWKIQPEDYIGCFYRDPKNYESFQQIRQIDFNVYPPEQIPQYHPLAMKEVFNIDCDLRWDGSFEEIANLLWDGNAIGLCLKVPSHFVLGVAFDRQKQLIGFKDPWAGDIWPKGSILDENNNKWFDEDDFSENVNSWFLFYERRSLA